MLVSAGFDAHVEDPLAQMLVTEEGFGRLARRCAALAPRVAAVLEGGYNLSTLGATVRAHVAALALALATLKNGADGFVHAQMHPAQVLRAVEVVQKGELAAPRQLLGYLLSHNENPKIQALSACQREILEMVVEGLSNAEIEGRLYLSESTIKQHLRAVYKVLGVRNRTEAAKTMRDVARGV